MTKRELTERMSIHELYMWAAADELDAADREQARRTAEAKSKLRH